MTERADPMGTIDDRASPQRLDESSASQYLASIVESSDDAIVAKDLDGIVTSWNRAAMKLFGYEAAEVIGQSIRIIIPSDRQAEEDLVLARVRRGESVNHFETIRQRKDGTLIPVSLTISPIHDRHGNVIGASKIARDISERRLAEAIIDRAARHASFLADLSGALTESVVDYEQILQTVVNITVPQIADWCTVDVVREDGRIARLASAHADPREIEVATSIRARYEDTSSPTSPASVIRTGQTSFIPHITDDMLVTAARGDEERLRLVRSLRLSSYLCVAIKGRIGVLGALSFVYSASGRRYTHADLRLAEDVASRVSLAIENAEAYRQLKRANAVKDDFLATLSHELRTPLNAILGYARMLSSGALGKERNQQALQVIERNATALAQIVEDVLDVSRIVSGKDRLHVQSVELEQVMRESLETVALAAEAKGISIQSIIDPGVGPVSGDPDRLKQVLWNLLSNAVKFTSRGGRIQTRLQRINSQVEIVVSDTGIGIPRELLTNIFERFRQAEPGTNRRYGGLGLGLAIARHIVEMHGGTIEAFSDGEGHGATFHVKLPVSIVHTDASRDRERVHPLVETPTDSAPVRLLNGIRALAVDDDEDSLRMLREILELAGADVHVARSAAAALRDLESWRPDVLLADIGMPEVDGFELIERIRRLPDPGLRDLPAAALTAYARSIDRARALASGFELHLSKPINPAELTTAVAALTRRRFRRD